MDLRDSLRTGDALLFCSNTPTGFLLKTSTSSIWNHSGIAVRFHEGKISFDQKGTVYVLETNLGVRFDPILGENRNGAGFSDCDYVFRKYNRIAVRSLHTRWRTPQLAARTLDFVAKYGSTPFPKKLSPFLNIWLGIEIGSETGEGEEGKEGMFCSELMSHYYEEVIGSQYEDILGWAYDGDLQKIFGSGSPLTHNMVKPCTFSEKITPHSPVFGKESIVYIREADLIVTTLQPFLLTMFLAMFVTIAYNTRTPED